MKIINLCSFLRKREGHHYTWFRSTLVLIALFAFSSQVWAQQQTTLKGQVVDEAGEVIIGASVTLDKSTKGTITDIDGNFTLLDVPSNGIISVSYLGYKTQQISINNQKSIKVTMKEDLSNLDEVVVIGYGTVKKRDLTGAVASVKNDIITLTPTHNPMEALQGRVSGLDITKESGQAGSGVNMQLRGVRSVNASGNPLFLIDGVSGDYSTLNPNDIESIEVLKDASSTAIYGPAGANGVIIITTKQGVDGKLNVNFNTYMGTNGSAKLPKLRSGDSYMDAVRLAKQESGTYTDETNLVDPAVYEAYKNGQNIDWTKAMLRSGFTQNYSLSVSSGTKTTKAYFSFNYTEEDGQYKNDNYKVYSANIKLDQQVKKWFAIGVNVQGSYSMQDKGHSKLDRAMAASPFGSLYNDDGTLNPYPVVGDNRMVNLLLSQDRDAYRDNSDRFRLYTTPYIRITPIKGLSLESRVNTALTYNTTKKFTGYGSYQMYDGLGTGGLNATPEQKKALVNGEVKNERNYNYTWENILTYNFKIGQNNEFTVTGVTTYSHNQKESSNLSAYGITSNEYLWTNLGVATGARNMDTDYIMSKGIGLIGRINYAYMGRYLFSASVREDGSSKLAKGHRWKSFPAVSGGWRISDEAFMKETRNWLDNLKLRVGYGVTGTAAITPYSSVSILRQGNYTLGGEKLTSYNYPILVNNPDLTWERSYSTNIGLDMTFLNGRVDLTADYFITNTKGVIWEMPIPVTNGGFDATQGYRARINMAETQTKGFELTLSTRNIITKDFKWTSAITFSNSKDKVKSIGDDLELVIKKDDTYKAMELGRWVNGFYDFKYDGVWQKGQEADAAVFGLQPGDFKIGIPGLVRLEEGKYSKTIIDENGQEVTIIYDASNKYPIADADKQIIGHETPDWSVGFQNTFTYKDFDLSVYMYARYGQMIKYDLLTSYDNKGLTNFPEYFDYWTSTNPSNDFPALNSERNVKDQKGFSGRAFVDASFFKIKNITLGYTMPAKLCDKLKVQKIRIYGTITNPLVLSKSHLLKDYDPERGGSLDYPLTKQLVFGLNLTF